MGCIINAFMIDCPEIMIKIYIVINLKTRFEFIKKIIIITYYTITILIGDNIKQVTRCRLLLLRCYSHHCNSCPI